MGSKASEEADEEVDDETDGTDDEKSKTTDEQPDTTDMPELESEESAAHRENEGKGLKILTPEKCLVD